VATLTGGGEQNPEIFFYFGLADIFFPRVWSQGLVKITGIIAGNRAAWFSHNNLIISDMSIIAGKVR
jgi:hypothetical protein